MVTPSTLKMDICLSSKSSWMRTSQALREVSEALKRNWSLYHLNCRRGEPRAVHTRVRDLPSRAGSAS